MQRYEAYKSLNAVNKRFCVHVLLKGYTTVKVVASSIPHTHELC